MGELGVMEFESHLEPGNLAPHTGHVSNFCSVRTPLLELDQPAEGIGVSGPDDACI